MIQCILQSSFGNGDKNRAFVERRNPYLGSDLIAALAGLEVYDFAHDAAVGFLPATFDE